MKYLIVGYGNIGHKRQAVLGKKCVATFDPSPLAKADFQNLEDIPIKIYNTAILSVPQSVKYQLAEHFLMLGKNVLVEKPFIITPQQSKHLLSLAKKNNVICHTSYNHRYEPNIIKIIKLLKTNFLGPLYHAHFIYSFGNIKERIGTWREAEFSVLEEIAPHLIDFANYFFGYQGKEFAPLIARKVESKIFDHWDFTTKDQKILFEVSAVTWKNVFSLDIYGEKGSIHINGLRKWGGSKLTIRKRIFPAGIPIEKETTDQGPDITWKEDFRFFEKMAKEGTSSLNHDLGISIALAILSLSTKTTGKNLQRDLYEQVLH